ncbi:MarR family winged helix-turn-helix transcriptional regulator [Methyloradius palustris]|uniref:MarR family transcriptional regulator n=1 Tax=Methyloradius palustris TaxID=2778876 RepID=A0A8D5FXX6_9PROT|nr:MarR family transcriptional regulator [Methyloradius palustris]BCM23765.1 MarR family transcriptional regulator [Methyloradius palustris]
MTEISKNTPTNIAIPESSGPEDSILLLIKNVHFAILRTVDKNIAPLDLTAMQWAPIMAIAKGYAKTAADLANIANIDTGAITRMLDRLESKGLLVRTRSTDDRRVVNLELTEEGQRMALQIPAVLFKSMNLHLNGFNSEELATLKSLLTRMLENIPDVD